MMIRRALVISLLATALVALVAIPAWAQDVDVGPEEGVEELDKSRALIDRALELYEEGDADAAYTAARNAYLDHFEYVEIPLRVRDEGLTLELEEDFAAFRNQIEAGTDIGAVEETVAELRRGLDSVERTLSEPGIAAPIIAAGYSFLILFREGFEAVLVVAAILGYLEASRNTQYRPAILRGVGLAAIATVVTFALASLVIDIAPVQREVIEAVTALLAVVVLFYVSFWLVTRLEHRRWMEFVKAKVWAAASTGSALALAGVGFTAVYREGFETVLFYQAIMSFAEGLMEWVVLGAVAAACVLGVIGWGIFKAGKRMPVKAFLTTAVVLVMVMSIAFVGNAVRALQEAAMIPVTFLESLPRLPIFLAELTGWHPTRETILAQVALAVVYVVGAVVTFVVLPRRERRAAPSVAPEQELETHSVEPESATRR
jgi:high-affinity iron transporter